MCVHSFPASPTTDDQRKPTGERYVCFYYGVLLFAVIMLYKVTTNLGLVKIKSFFPEENTRVRFLWPSGHNIFTNQWLCQPVLGAFLFKTLYLISTVDFQTLSLLPADLYPRPARAIYTHIFSVRLVTAFLYSGSLDSTSALGLRATLIGKITNKKQKHMKTWH